MPSFTAEVTATADVDFEVYCGECGAGLCSQSKATDSVGRRWARVTVMPCKSCLKEAHDEGCDEGYDEGYSAGIDDARSKMGEE